MGCRSTAQRTASDDAGELEQEAVATGLDDPAAVFCAFGSISSRRCAFNAAGVALLSHEPDHRAIPAQVKSCYATFDGVSRGWIYYPSLAELGGRRFSAQHESHSYNPTTE